MSYLTRAQQCFYHITNLYFKHSLLAPVTKKECVETTVASVPLQRTWHIWIKFQSVVYQVSLKCWVCFVMWLRRGFHPKPNFGVNGCMYIMHFSSINIFSNFSINNSTCNIIYPPNMSNMTFFISHRTTHYWP